MSTIEMVIGGFTATAVVLSMVALWFAFMAHERIDRITSSPPLPAGEEWESKDGVR